MKNKNKFILGLILGIFLIGLVSASITGYLVSRGGGIVDAGYTAVLQKVRSGVATVDVTTPEGTTEVIAVREGGTAQVGEATISASSLTKGTLFRRGGAEVKINVVPASGVGGVATGVAGAHTHLTDYANTNPIYNNVNSATFLPGSNGVNVDIEISCANPQDIPISAGFNLDFKTPKSTDRLPVIQYSYLADKTYYTGFFDPDHIIIPTGSWGFVSCASIEQAIGSGEPHFN